MGRRSPAQAEVAVNLEKGLVKVSVIDGQTASNAVVRAIEEAGYKVHWFVRRATAPFLEATSGTTKMLETVPRRGFIKGALASRHPPCPR